MKIQYEKYKLILQSVTKFEKIEDLDKFLEKEMIDDIELKKDRKNIIE